MKPNDGFDETVLSHTLQDGTPIRGFLLPLGFAALMKVTLLPKGLREVAKLVFPL